MTFEHDAAIQRDAGSVLRADAQPSSAPERRRGGRRSPAGAARKHEPRRPPQARDTLDQYMRSIRHVPVLSSQQTSALAETLRREEARFRDALYSIPEAADLVVRRWRRRRDAGLVTGMICELYATDRSPRWSEHVDRILGQVERLRRQSGARGAAPRGRVRKPETGLDTQVSQLLQEAKLDFDVALGVHRELRRQLRAGPRRRAGMSLREAVAREAFARAEHALELRDAALQTFVRHNLKLVVNMARRYRDLGVEFLDLIQEGTLGLIRAVQKFDHTRGFKFSTYAVWWIEQALIRAIQNQSRTVRVPSHIYERQLRYRQAERVVRGTGSGEPNTAEIARIMQISEADVENLRTTMSPLRSLDEIVPGSEDRTLEDRLADENAVDPVEVVGEAELSHTLNRSLAMLQPRERQVLIWRYGLGEESAQTLEAVGRRLQLSRERVRQIEGAAFRKLRSHGALAELAGMLAEAADVGSRG